MVQFALLKIGSGIWEVGFCWLKVRVACLIPLGMGENIDLVHWNNVIANEAGFKETLQRPNLPISFKKPGSVLKVGLVCWIYIEFLFKSALCSWWDNYEFWYVWVCFLKALDKTC